MSKAIIVNVICILKNKKCLLVSNINPTSFGIEMSEILISQKLISTEIATKFKPNGRIDV